MHFALTPCFARHGLLYDVPRGPHYAVSEHSFGNRVSLEETHHPVYRHRYVVNAKVFLNFYVRKQNHCTLTRHSTLYGVRDEW